MGGQLGIFPSFRASMTIYDSHLASLFQVLDQIHGVILRILLSSTAYTRESLECFQVPGHLYREKAMYESIAIWRKSLEFFKSQSLYGVKFRIF